MNAGGRAIEGTSTFIYLVSKPYFLRQIFAIGRKESFKTIRSNATLYDFLNFKIKVKMLLIRASGMSTLNTNDISVARIR